MKPHIILWDGRCGLCRRSIEWVMKRDKKQLFLEYPYQRAPSPPMTESLMKECEEAVHVVSEDGRIYRGGSAALFILEQIGCGRLAKLFSCSLLLPITEAAYRFVARHSAIFSWIFSAGCKGEECSVSHSKP